MNSENNGTTSIADLLFDAANSWPQKPAITFLGETQTWLETKNRCHAAATLFVRAGVRRGDRVAYLGLNSNVCFESYFAPALIGAILVPINYRLSIREMIECVEDCEPSVLIVDENFIEQADQLKDACKSLQTIISFGDPSCPKVWFHTRMGFTRSFLVRNIVS
jgi:acyl-CoA synthetase (AMP-forming)/AMP-acid ligase II